MIKFALLLLSSLLVSGCIPLILLWGELNPREGYRIFHSGQNIDPIPEAEIDPTILEREFEGVCQPRAYLDDTPIYAAIRLEGVIIERKHFEFSGLSRFKKENIDVINSLGDKEINCKKFTKCLNNISVKYINIGEYPFALLYLYLKNGKEGNIRGSVSDSLHYELNNRFSVKKCLADPDNGKYFYFDPWFYDK
ncbi:MAG: hypothetical protein ACOVQ8_04580 [Elstera sp.]